MKLFVRFTAYLMKFSFLMSCSILENNRLPEKISIIFLRDQFRSLFLRRHGKEENNKTNKCSNQSGYDRLAEFHPKQHAFGNMLQIYEHRVYIVLRNGDILSIHQKLNELQEELKPLTCFLRCHQSYIVNLNYVEALEPIGFLMKIPSFTPVSSFRASFKLILLPRTKGIRSL